MSIEKELETPLRYSGNLIIIMIEVIVIILLVFLFYDYFWKIIKNYMLHKDLPKLHDKYIKKLKKLLMHVEDGKMDLKEAYLRLSIIIREFIEKATGINVLNLSKSEIQKLGIKDLSLLMEEYYPPEFSQNLNSDIASSIKRTINLIKNWE